MSGLYESLPALLAATIAFAIGTSVILRDRTRDAFVLFAVFCFNLGLFHLTSFFDHFTGVALFGWAAQSLSLLLPWSADRCFSSFVPHDSGQRRFWRTWFLVAFLVAQIIALFVLLTGSPEGIAVDQGGLLHWVSIGLDVYVFTGLLLVTSRIWQAARNAEGTAIAPRMRYLFYASLLALIFGSRLIPAFGPIVTAVYLYFVAQTLVRERLLDLPELLSKIATLTLLVLSLTALYALLLLWIPDRAPGRNSLFLFNSAVASYAVIVLIDPIRAEFQSRIERLLFRDRSALNSMLVALRIKLLNVIDPTDMVDRVMDALRESNRVTRASMYLLDNHGTHLILRGEIGGQSKRRIDMATRRPLVERMRSHGPLLRDVLQREHERAEREHEVELAEVLSFMGDLGASLAIPILSPAQGEAEDQSSPEVIGALFVDDERLLEPFSREEVALFGNLAAQAAITLQNSAAYEQRKERERLAALGEMAAGLAHEIRNPLGAIKGAVQVVQPSIEPDSQTAEFLDVIVEEVERLNRVVTQFLSYSRRYVDEPASVDLDQLLDATLRLIPAEQAPHIHVDRNRKVPHVLGDAESLRQVFHNLLLNAIDATQSQGTNASIWIEYRLRRRGLMSSDAVAITVRDNGHGLSPHTMSHLFIPFHTTKSGGTGLGLPICQRIIENHGGTIEVSNAIDGGASFTVLLPIDENTVPK